MAAYSLLLGLGLLGALSVASGASCGCENEVFSVKRKFDSDSDLKAAMYNYTSQYEEGGALVVAMQFNNVSLESAELSKYPNEFCMSANITDMSIQHPGQEEIHTIDSLLLDFISSDEGLEIRMCKCEPSSNAAICSEFSRMRLRCEIYAGLVSDHFITQLGYTIYIPENAGASSTTEAPSN